MRKELIQSNLLNWTLTQSTLSLLSRELQDQGMPHSLSDLKKAWVFLALRLRFVVPVVEAAAAAEADTAAAAETDIAAAAVVSAAVVADVAAAAAVSVTGSGAAGTVVRLR